MSGKRVLLDIDPKKCTPNSEVTWDGDDFKGKGEEGFFDHVLRVDATMIGSSSGTVAAPSLAQRKSVLATITGDFRFDMGKDALAAVQGPENSLNPFHPQQAEGFDKLRIRALRLLRTEVVGLTEATATSLATGYTAGAFTRKVVLLVSFGRVEQFINDSEALFGVGPQLLELLRVTIRPKSDGLNAYNNALTVSEFRFQLSTIRYPESSGANRLSIPPMTRRFRPSPNRSPVVTLPMVPVDALDMNAPLASTSLGILTVKVGETTVTKRPDTPATVHETLTLANLNNPSDVDTTVALDATPVYEVGDTKFANVLGGTLSAVQETYAVQWDLEETGLPQLTDGDVQTAMAAACRQGLKGSQRYHFTTAAGLAGMKTIPGNLLPAVGLSYFPEDHPKAQETPGIRMGLDGRPTYAIPQTYLGSAIVEYSQALKNGDAAAMAGVCNRLGLHFPGYSVDPEKGYPSDGGEESAVYKGLRAMLQKAARTALGG